LVGNIEIGEGVLIAPNVLISSGSHIFSQRSSDFIKFQDEDFCIDKPVFIGSDCWIGYNVTILPGVVAGGIPARVLKPRLDFLPPSKLSARNINDLPYWSNGLRTFVKNVECFALQEQSFSFYLSKENPKNLFLKFKAPGGGVFSIQIIINGQAQSKVTSRDTFKIDLDVKNSSIYLVEARVFDLKVSEVELGIEEVWIV
jgi:hypothetical protein